MAMRDVAGVGLGFRRDIADEIISTAGFTPKFLEIAPENWMNVGGFWGKKLRAAAERFPFTTHGLSLSLGSPEELDWEFLKGLKKFFKEFPVAIYSEHLSYAKCDNAHLYDLLPIPFCEDAVKHVTQRIRDVQDFLERPIAIENVSYYTPLAPELSEQEFISAIVNESGCKLLLDVNNVYVNSFNHKYDPYKFIAELPLDQVAYIHMAGHEQRTPELIIDTHGEPIIEPVYDLFSWTVERVPAVPILLERDFNFPQFEELQSELGRLDSIVTTATNQRLAA
jgi:uncharacterized protein (UPF0276 family)